MTVDDVENRLIYIVALHYDVVMGGGDTFASVLGLDSLEVAEFILNVEDEWPSVEDKINLDDPNLQGTLHELANTIHQIIGRSV